MRSFTKLLSFILASTVHTSYSSELDCTNISSDLDLLKTLTETGQYRNIVRKGDIHNFDYKITRSYQEYLTFARQKIAAENPKATMKCPIESIVTKQHNIPKANIEVTDLITPFELSVANSKQVILLIHGLTDSPYVFHDLAAFYHEKGFTVRTLLLPGHGTAPEALIDVDYNDWQQATEYAINRTLQDFDEVYLGGFSTGGALILDNLISSPQNVDKLKGVMLWAPASKAKSSIAWAAQIVDWIPFMDYSGKSADVDFAKYESFPLNAAAQVHALMNTVENKLNKSKNLPDIPFFTVASAVDATINTPTTIDMLSTWHNAKNRTTSQFDTLFYFGDPTSLDMLPTSVNRIIPSCDDKTFCNNIINVAHTAMVINPTNSHYGWQGSYRNCETLLGTEHYKSCKLDDNIMLGETTLENLEQEPNLNRLTFNPNFQKMTNELSEFLTKTKKVAK